MSLNNKFILVFAIISVCIFSVQAADFSVFSLNNTQVNFLSNRDALEFLEKCLRGIKAKDTEFLAFAVVDEQYILPSAQEIAYFSLSKKRDLAKVYETISIESRVKNIEEFEYAIFSDRIEREDENTVKIYVYTKDQNGENQGYLTIGLRNGSLYLLVGHGNKKFDYTSKGNIIGYAETSSYEVDDPYVWEYHHHAALTGCTTLHPHFPEEHN